MCSQVIPMIHHNSAPTYIWLRALISCSILTLHFPLYRLPGVYGPGEEIIVKRTYAYINSFISSFFVLHKKDLKIDWIHVRNVIQAQTKVNKSFVIANENSKLK